MVQGPANGPFVQEEEEEEQSLYLNHTICINASWLDNLHKQSICVFQKAKLIHAKRFKKNK